MKSAFEMSKKMFPTASILMRAFFVGVFGTTTFSLPSFAVDAASYLVSIAFLIPVRVHERLQETRQRFWHDLAEGWHEVRNHRWLTAGFLGFALGNVGIGLYIVLGPLVAQEHFGGAKAWGLILAAGAIGGVLGGLAGYRFRVSRPVVAAFAVWAAGGLTILAFLNTDT